MDPFLRRLSILMALLVLAGCGPRRGAPPGDPYLVTFAQGVMTAPTPAPPRASASSRSSGGGGSWGSCDLKIGSGSDALVGIVVVIAVVIVVAVVVLVIEGATAGPDPVVARYHLTMSGEGVPLEVVTISVDDRIYLEWHQYEALTRGAYTSAVLRADAWTGTGGAPTQAVRITAEHRRIVIAPLEEPAATP